MKIFPFIICLLSIQFIQAQTNITPVNLELGNGEKMTGTIDFKDWAVLPEEILFTQANGQTLPIRPESLPRMTIESEPAQIIIGKVFPVAQFRTSLERLPISKEVITVKDSVFMRAMVVGTVSLYYLKDKYGGMHYFVEKEGEMEELLYHKYYVVKDAGEEDRYYNIKSGKSIKSMMNYKSSLYTRMKDCAALNEALQSTEDFNIKTIKKMVIQYNQCTSNSHTDFIETPIKVKKRVGLKAGAALSTVQTKNGRNQYDNAIGLTGGIAFSFNLPRNQRKNTAQFEFLYTRVNNVNASTTLPLNINLYSLVFLFKHNIVNTATKVNLQAGYKMNFATDDIPNGVIAEVRPYGSTHGFFVGMGMAQGIFEVDLRFAAEDMQSLFQKFGSFVPYTLSLTGAVFLGK